jgi:hypothetical protein
VKIGDIANGSTLVLFSSGDGTTSNYCRIEVVTNQIQFINVIGASSAGSAQTTAVFRDPSAWYHVVVAVDTTQSTAANRALLYVNGVNIAWTISPAVTQNSNTWINSTNAHYLLGRQSYSAANYFDGYAAEVNFIDGQALTPSSFGAFDSNGIWQPLSYRGTYGTNGFYLNFSDNSAATAAAIGKDYSGNGNNWTPNNISVTAGVTYDSMLDSPTNSPDGGNGRGNYAVLNPIQQYVSGGASVISATVSDGNLKATGIAASNRYTGATIIPNSGKYYCEWTIGATQTTNYLGFITVDGTLNYTIYYANGTVLKNTGAAGTVATYTAGDVIGVAWDVDNGAVTFYKNGTSQSALTGVTDLARSIVSIFQTTNTDNANANFGQRPFAYTPPTGFKALNTQNLPAVNINNGAQYMNAVTYTGNSGSQTVSNGVFQPDLTWHKTRSVVASHVLFDSIRGASSGLNSDATSAQNNNWTGQSFTSTGFTVSNSYSSESNYNGQTMVAWQWKAAGSSVSNTSGSITSTVNAGTTQGFSVVTFTSSVNGTPTIGHGLGVAPSMIITKSRSSTDTWLTYHASLGATKGIALQTTGAAVTSANYWNNTAPTSSVFTINATASGNFYNTSQTYVAYCFAQVAGYSAFGTYTGNGSADGPFVYTGFRPRYIMWKRTDSTSDWSIIDSSRSTYNVQNDELYADLSSAETAAGAPRLDSLSNGFKIRNAGGAAINASGGTYIYACFAENPFNIARAK